ncbi:hypothetical protein [Archangium minus]|uniref:hypothetical protein n=1 Tax=Archangium minus TaxID=83450 RepID=UPI0037C140DF
MEKTVRRGVNRIALVVTGLVMACEPSKDGGAGAKLDTIPRQDVPAESGQGAPSVPGQGAPSEPLHDGSYVLSTDGSTYRAGAAINVSWSAPATHSLGDWVGIFKVGEPDASFLAKKYVPAGSSGLLTLSAPPQSGNYELRYLPDTASTIVSVSNPFTVSVTAGNIFLFSNYEGGTYTLVVDQNLPNIQIGIASYMPSHVTLTGPYVGNVSVVRVTGYNSAQSTVHGVPSSKVQLVAPEPVTHKQPYANNRSLSYSTGQRVLSWAAGGGNSTTQVEEYFMSKFGEVSFLSHMSRYAPFSGNIPLSVARLNLVVVRDTTNFNVAAAAGQPSGAVNITVDVNATVSATSTLTPAFTTGALASGSTVQLNNYASILGAGGAGGSGGNGGSGGRPRACGRNGLPGGTAIHLTVPATLNNRGNVWGGGGGGGGGSGCNQNAGGGGGAGHVGGTGGAGASQLSNSDELAFCGQDNGVRAGVPGGAGGSVGGEGGKAGDYAGDGSYSMVGGDGGGYGQPGQPAGACGTLSPSYGGAAGAAIKRNGNVVNVLDGTYDTGGGRIRGPVAP